MCVRYNQVISGRNLKVSQNFHKARKITNTYWSHLINCVLKSHLPVFYKDKWLQVQFEIDACVIVKFPFFSYLWVCPQANRSWALFWELTNIKSINSIWVNDNFFFLHLRREDMRIFFSRFVGAKFLSCPRIPFFGIISLELLSGPRSWFYETAYQKARVSKTRYPRV